MGGDRPPSTWNFGWFLPGLAGRERGGARRRSGPARASGGLTVAGALTVLFGKNMSDHWNNSEDRAFVLPLDQRGLVKGPDAATVPS